MTRSEVRRIGDERLNRWLCKLVDSHATPAFMVGFGHDHNAGTVTICACEDFNEEVLLDMLVQTVELLKERCGLK